MDDVDRAMIRVMEFNVMLILLQIHITLMIASLLMSTIGVTFAAIGKSMRSRTLLINLTVTTLGLTSGVLLLTDAPLSPRCLALGAYLVVFTFAYRYMISKRTVVATQIK